MDTVGMVKGSYLDLIEASLGVWDIYTLYMTIVPVQCTCTYLFSRVACLSLVYVGSFLFSGIVFSYTCSLFKFGSI